MSQENEPIESTRDSVLYIIDDSQSMAESGALDKSLQAACDAIRATAKLGDSHYDAGVLVYNVEGAKNGVQVLLSLGGPRIDDLKKLMRLAVDKSQREATIKPGKSSTGVIASALRVAKAEINKLRVRSLRRIILITDDDDPCGGQAREIEVTQTFSTDLTEMQVAIFPVFIETDLKPKFNVDLFWHKLSYVPPPMSTAASRRDWHISMRPVGLKELGASFNNLVFSKSRRKTSAFRGRLRLEALDIGIRGYNVVQSRPRRPAGFHVVYVKDDDGRERREVVSNVRKVADKWSGKEIEPGEVTKAFSLTSKNEPDVPVSTEQYEELRQFSDSQEAVFDVYGFVSIDAIGGSLVGYVGHSVLLIPSNDVLQNSYRAFGSLHRSMQRLRQVALVAVNMASGRRTPPSLGLLYAFDPAPRVYEKQRIPEPSANAGLYYVPLPFADDVRHIPAHAESPALSDERVVSLKELVHTLVHKFRLETGFDPARFNNPRFAQFAAVLESLALSLEMETKDEEGRIPREQRDPSKPRYEKISRNVGNLSARVRDALDSIGRAANGPKKEPLQGSGPPPAKRPREKHGEDLKLDEFRAAYAQGTLDKFVVADLKWALKELTGRAPNAKKVELVAALKDELASG